MNHPMSVYELGFALVETALFLDTHPDNAEALEYYHQIKHQYDAAVDEYNRTCAPLTIDSVHSHDDWTWAKTPWPWEGGSLCGIMKNDCNIQ
ncbi:MAG: spore coat protein CotJB [Lachnospiraceae bacterium]|nr:spore coat protein CotJB [Lachnospiraceae bacterium]